MKHKKNNAEQIIIGLSSIFSDSSSFPEGKIKKSIKRIKILANNISNKNSSDSHKKSN